MDRGGLGDVDYLSATLLVYHDIDLQLAVVPILFLQFIGTRFTKKSYGLPQFTVIHPLLFLPQMLAGYKLGKCADSHCSACMHVKAVVTMHLMSNHFLLFIIYHISLLSYNLEICCKEMERKCCTNTVKVRQLALIILQDYLYFVRTTISNQRLDALIFYIHH